MKEPLTSRLSRMSPEVLKQRDNYYGNISVIEKERKDWLIIHEIKYGVNKDIDYPKESHPYITYLYNNIETL